jgi:hypothetical protein
MHMRGAIAASDIRHGVRQSSIGITSSAMNVEGYCMIHPSFMLITSYLLN